MLALCETEADIDADIDALGEADMEALIDAEGDADCDTPVGNISTRLAALTEEVAHVKAQLRSVTSVRDAEVAPVFGDEPALSSPSAQPASTVVPSFARWIQQPRIPDPVVPDESSGVHPVAAEYPLATDCPIG
jgi:hypothetical protein